MKRCLLVQRFHRFGGAVEPMAFEGFDLSGVTRGGESRVDGDVAEHGKIVFRGDCRKMAFAENPVFLAAVRAAEKRHVFQQS